MQRDNWKRHFRENMSMTKHSNLQKKIIFLLNLIVFSIVCCRSQDTVNVVSYGLKPNSGTDACPYIRKIMQHVGDKQTVIVFPKGRYDFYPHANTDVCFLIDNKKNITVDGQGSNFVYHRICQSFYIHKSENICLKNFSIDWDKTFSLQAKITQITNNFVEIYIPPSFDFTVKDYRLYIIGDNGPMLAATINCNLLSKKDSVILSNSTDNDLGTIFEQKAKSLKNRLVRFYGQVPKNVPIGTYVIIRSDMPHRDVICFDQCKKVSMKNIQIYYGTGHAISTYLVDNIEIDNACATINTSKGRLFSTEQDNYHANNCKGKIYVSNCVPTGMGDDAINIHGRYFKIKQRDSNQSLIVNIPDAHPNIGEDVWTINGKSLSRTHTLKIIDIKDIGHDNGQLYAKITFGKTLPKDIGYGDYLESMTWTPDVEISHCIFKKKNRARGLLVTTPRNILIHDNIFKTAGAAIMINGDTKLWYEAGACNNVTISNNIFDHCLTSGTSSNGWGSGIISITPMTTSNTIYHQNINITNNCFYSTDKIILYAKSVKGLKFSGNTIEKSDGNTPEFVFDSCKSIQLESNKIAFKPKLRLVSTREDEINYDNAIIY